MLTKNFGSWIRRLCGPTATPVARKPLLQLETLEERNTPSVSPNNLFVASLYQGLLGRPADANGLAYWTGQLSAGATRADVAQGIATSHEAQGHDVNLFYEALLNRPADPAGLAYGTNLLQSGMTLDQMKAQILGSDEFFKVAGGTTSDFLQGLYQYELGVPLNATGFTYWNNLMSEGLPRTGVAQELLATANASQVKTASFYIDTLARLPGADGINYWTPQLQAHVPETTVLAGILGSTEYFNRVEQAAQTPLTDANAAATQMINSAPLFNGPLPNAEYLALKFTYVPVHPVDFSYLIVPPASNTVDNSAATSNGNSQNNTTVVVTNNTTTNVTVCPPFTAPCDDGSTDTSSTDDSSCDTSTDCGDSDGSDCSDDGGSDSSDCSGSDDTDNY